MMTASRQGRCISSRFGPDRADYAPRHLRAMGIMLFAAFTLLGPNPITHQKATALSAKIASRNLFDIPSGLIVAQTPESSDLEHPSVQRGDVILGWKQGKASGAIGSPFDLLELQEEQIPFGAIMLEGLRNNENTTWIIERGLGDLSVRPNLPDQALALYERATQVANQTTAAESERLWRRVVTEANEFRCSWLLPWVLSRAATEFSDKREWKSADSFYREAIEAAYNDPTAASFLLHQWGATFEFRSQPQTAERLYHRSLEILQNARPESFTLAAAFDALGDLALRLGNPARAEEFHLAALTIRKKLAPDTLISAKSLNLLGADAFLRGCLSKSEELHRQALAIQQKLNPNSMEAAKSLAALGRISLKRDDLIQAAQYFRQSLEIQQLLAPGALDIAFLLDNLGALALKQSDLVSAEKYHRRALSIEESHGHEGLHLANTLSSLGLVLKCRGDYREAEQYQIRALEIREKFAPRTLPVSASLDELGTLALAQGKPDAAQDYLLQALKIREDLAPDSLDVATSLNHLGYLYRERGDEDKAENHHHRALALIEAIAPDSLFYAEDLNALGDIASDRGDLSKSEAYYRKALAIREKLAPGSAGYAESLASLATILRLQGQLDAAAKLFEDALNALESQASRLGGTSENRSRFRARHESCYTRYIDLLISQKKPDLAFRVWERFQARSLVELLAESRIDIRKGIDPDLAAELQTLQRSLDAKAVARIKTLNDKDADDTASAINLEIADLLAQYNEVERRIRANSPGYAALTQPRALSATEVQAQLLGPDTLLLEYSLSDEHSYVWAITPNSLDAYELPTRAAIEASAQRLYSILMARDCFIPDETRQQQRNRIAEADARYPEAAAELGTMILGPVARQLGTKRLLIIGDGALQYIPFSVLPEPGNRDGKSSFATLVKNHEIVNLPSASALAVLRDQAARRTPATKELAVLADPVFDKDDMRVREEHGRNRLTPVRVSKFSPPGAEHLTRSTKGPGLNQHEEFHLARLPFTREEAETIMAHVPPGEGMEALDFEASRKTISDRKLGQYRMVHIATHALVDNRRPELSGLVLSLVDESGYPVDGFLNLQDIYNLDLSADLVVLSACSTGLGVEVRGDGMVGLTRGFMYAGAARVMSSLWEVDDVATSKLMGAFYKAIQQDHMKPGAALRQAQLAMQTLDNWNAPYYWAGFQLQGEWK
ncbi:MAG TPA: CHAT domain-containing protein [Candidatus Angelobacter sp.]|nr:CHAT domain-containing protein [Candidatus Angelobacter sp.]